MGNTAAVLLPDIFKNKYLFIFHLPYTPWVEL